MTTILFIAAIALLVINVALMCFVWRKEFALKLTHNTTNVINQAGDYYAARAIILSHLIEAWDKERWQQELTALDAAMACITSKTVEA